MYALASTTEGEPEYLRKPITGKTRSLVNKTFILCSTEGKENVANRPATGGIVSCHHSFNGYFQEEVGNERQDITKGKERPQRVPLLR
jgi:hypothetical protein